MNPVSDNSFSFQHSKQYLSDSIITTMPNNHNPLNKSVNDQLNRADSEHF